MAHLVSADQLGANLESVRVYDIRWKLGQPGHGLRTYEEGHIPGAIFVDLDSDLSGPPSGARHPLPDLADFGATLGRLGLLSTDPVVVYDDVSGMVAARMWWMLTSIGHDRVSLLDGGLDSWKRAGQPLEIGGVKPTPTDYAPARAYTGVVTADDLSGRQVVDVRASDRYTGASEPVDPRPGHIPGAINLPATLNLQEGRFTEGKRLARLYRGLDDPVLSCGSGVVACHTALAMVVAGRDMPDIYVGSFSEWSNSDRPIATGAHP